MRGYTIYDHMTFPEYQYRDYPKMFYHPKGEQEIIERGQTVMMPSAIPGMPPSPMQVGERKDVITKLAQNSHEEAMLRQQGWHDHPGKAVAAREGKEWQPPVIPYMGASPEELERQILFLQSQLLKARGEAQQKREAIAALERIQAMENLGLSQVLADAQRDAQAQVAPAPGELPPAAKVSAAAMTASVKKA